MAKALFIGTKKGFFTLSRSNGERWRVIHRALEGVEVSDLVFQREQNRRWADSDGKGAFYSTDGGDTWTHLSEGLGRFGYDFSFHPDRPEQILFAAGIGEPPHWANHPEGARAQVYRSEDGGDSWNKMDVGNPQGTKLMLYEFAVDPENPDHLWLVAGDEVSRVFEAPGKCPRKFTARSSMARFTRAPTAANPGN